MEKQSVEGSFRNAFQEAEMRPSSEVWAHIELAIEKESGDKLKKRVVYYRWMAAASILLAISLVTVGYFTFVKDAASQNTIVLNTDRPQQTPEKLKNENANDELASNEYNPSNLERNQNEVATEKLASTTGHVNGSETILKTHKELKSISPIRTGLSPVAKDKQTIAAGSTSVLIDQDEPQARQQIARAKSPLPPLFVQRPYRLHFPKTEPDQIDLLLAAIEMEEKEAKKKQSEAKETFWTSVAMAAGSYNPISTSSSSNSPVYAMDATGSLGNAQVVNLSNQVEASGYSFSSGISVGGKISNRWILQGGVNYLTQNSNYSTNAVLVDGANNLKLTSINTLNSEAFSGSFQASNPYQVSSTLKYFNVPIQAGYLIINKAFGWQMQGGVSTDLFLQNTLSAADAGLEKISQRGGDESPYRTVNFSGLLGTEVSYRFGEHYRVAVNPGLRYPLQSIYKNDLGVNAAPITFDVGLKFHYIFR